jgi:predicted DNA binding protein
VAALDLDGIVPVSDAELLVYLRVTPDDATAGEDVAERVVEAAAGSGGVTDARRVDGDTVELSLSAGSLLSPLLDLGANVRSLHAADGRVRVVAELADDDVRTTVERVRASFPGVELLARRERAYLPDDDGAPTEVEDLTDRQHEALEAAYRAGYFDWPRDSTAEEVAEAMDITSPTLQQHLRTAHRKLLGVYFDDGE